MIRFMSILAVLALILTPNAIDAQNSKPNTDIVRIFHLNTTSQLETSSLAGALQRALNDPSVRIQSVETQNVIIATASPEQIATIERLIADLDHAHNSRTYRLTYTLADFDNGKRVGTQHYSMLVVNGQRTTMKQGDKVPVLTGSFSQPPGSSVSQSQIQFLDIGMNFDATLDEFSSGVRLRSKIEQSSVAETKSVAAVDDPIVRQTVLEGTSFLTLGKPLTLGSLDITGTPRHVEISVLMELVP